MDNSAAAAAAAAATTLYYASWHESFVRWLRQPQSACRACVVWGPVGCGKSFAVRTLLARYRVRTLHLDGDDDVLAGKETRQHFLEGLLRARSDGAVMLIDDADSHGANAGLLLKQFVAAIKARSGNNNNNSRVVGGSGTQAVACTRLVFIANDKYASHCEQLSRPYSGGVLHLVAKHPTGNTLRQHAIALAAVAPEPSPSGLLKARTQPVATSVIDTCIEACGRDFRTLERLVADYRAGQDSSVDGGDQQAIDPFTVARDLLGFVKPDSPDDPPLPPFAKTRAVLARTNADVARWLVAENWLSVVHDDFAPKGPVPGRGRSANAVSLRRAHNAATADALLLAANVADAFSLGDVLSPGADDQYAMPAEYGREYLTMHTPSMLLAAARQRIVAGTPKAHFSGKAQLAVKSKAKDTARYARAAANMAIAGVRDQVLQLQAAGRLHACSDGHGWVPHARRADLRRALAAAAPRRRDYLVAQGIVEPWDGAGALPAHSMYVVSGTGCIEQHEAFDPLGIHKSKSKKRDVAAADETARKRQPQQQQLPPPKRARTTGKSDGRKQLLLPRMFAFGR